METMRCLLVTTSLLRMTVWELGQRGRGDMLREHIRHQRVIGE
jgi:hypothetical protein